MRPTRPVSALRDRTSASIENQNPHAGTARTGDTQQDVTPARKMRAEIRHGIANDDGLASSKAAGRGP
jgi:hypothetical protein